MTHSHWKPCRKYVLKVFLWFHLCYCSDHDFIHFYCWVAFPHMNTSQFIPLWKGIWAVSSFGRLHIKLRWTLLHKAFPGFTVSLLQDKIIRSGITGLQGRYTFNFFRETAKFSTVVAFHARYESSSCPETMPTFGAVDNYVSAILVGGQHVLMRFQLAFALPWWPVILSTSAYSSWPFEYIHFYAFLIELYTFFI